MKYYNKNEILNNSNIVIHCVTEEQWEILRKEFPDITSCIFKQSDVDCMRPGGGKSSVCDLAYYKTQKKGTIIIEFEQFNENGDIWDGFLG